MSRSGDHLNGGLMLAIRSSGRSWWQAQYQDGRVLSEWETQRDSTDRPVRGLRSTSRWEQVPKRGIVALRLIAPTGQIGELRDEGTEPGRGVFFQFKVGGMELAPSVCPACRGAPYRSGVGYVRGIKVVVEGGAVVCEACMGTGFFGSRRYEDAHIIGAVHDDDGHATVIAWETQPHAFRLLREIDPASDPDGRVCAVCRLNRGECGGSYNPPRQMVSFRDGVAPMRYRAIGNIALENVGVLTLA